MNTIVIQTALLLEEKPVLDKLSHITDYINPSSKTIYKVGTYKSKNNTLQIIVGRTNQTNVNAGIETERIIKEFNPSYIFFVGIAGGIKDVQVGDVVIGSDVVGYERGKITSELQYRPKFGFSSYDLEQQAVNFSMSPEWKNISSKLVNTKFQKEILTYSGTIASGEKVIASSKSEVYKFLKNNWSHAIAVEMEGLGFLEACRPYPLIKSLLIRGISDLIDNKNLSDEEGSQDYASKNAVEFLFGLIDYLGIVQCIDPLTLKQKLFEILPKLYPEGLKDKGIWVRAGGDLALVNLSTNGKAQWIEAIHLIENGGGGKIDYKLLIKEMKTDFQNNISLKEL